MKENGKPLQERGEEVEERYYRLSLYVAGATGNSLRAIINTKKICEEYLKGRYELEVIDVYLSPDLAQQAQIVAIPTLLVKDHYPQLRMVGDMSETEKVLKGLGIG